MHFSFSKKTFLSFFCLISGMLSLYPQAEVQYSEEELKKQLARSESPVITYQAGDEYRVIDTLDLAVRAGSALDCSHFSFKGSIDERGRVIVSEQGLLSFASEPETPVRFFGCSVGQPILRSIHGDKKAIEAYVDRVARQGYNLIRPHFLDHFLMHGGESDFDLNEERLDTFDYMIYCMKKRNVYLYFDVLTSWSGYRKGTGWKAWDEKLKSRIITEEEIKQHWLTALNTLLRRENKYTETQLWDDPMLAVLLMYNEQEWYPRSDDFPEVFLPRWQAFLKQKFETVDAMNEAFKGEAKFESVDSFEALPLPEKETFVHTDGYSQVFGAFLFEQELEMTDWYLKQIETLDFPGLISQWDWSFMHRHSVLRNAFPVTSIHKYHAHPNGWIKPGARISQSSSLRNLNYFTTVAATRFVDRPLWLSEYGHCFWNQFRHEEGLVIGAYSAFQNYSGLNRHSMPVTMEAEEMKPFRTGWDPINRASQFVTGHLFMASSLKPASKWVVVEFDDEFVFEGNHANHKMNNALKQLSLVAGLAIDYTGERVSAPSDFNEEQKVTADYTIRLNENRYGKKDLPLVIEHLREKGVIATDNRTDVREGRFENEHGQIFYDRKKKLLSVISSSIEGICLKGDEVVDLGQLTDILSSVPCALTAIALDQKSLSESERIVFVYATDARNSGMKVKKGGRELVHIGKLPMLLKTGQVSFSLACNRDKEPKLYALGLNGERQEMIPVVKEGEQLKVEIDTASLEKGASVFFELVDK